MSSGHCQQSKPDGTPCQAKPVNGSAYCFFHDPDKAEDRKQAQSHGGRQNKAQALPGEVEDIPVQNPQDVVTLLSVTINQVRKGELDPKVSNAVGYLANILLKAMEHGDISDRLNQFELVIRRQEQTPLEIPEVG